MKIRNFYYILLGIFAFSVIACEEANEWEVDPSHDRLFRSTKFEVKETNPTSALLSFRGVTNATKYVFDFSVKKVKRTKESALLYLSYGRTCPLP